MDGNMESGGRPGGPLDSGGMADSAFYASLPRTRGAAAALLLDERGRILLVKPTYKDGWFMPGGVIEANESPLAACRRECAEELGVDAALDGLACVDWGPPRDGVDAVNIFVFAGRITGEQIDAIRLPADELSDYTLRVPDDVGDLVPPHIGRRLGACLRAAAGGPVAYLEDGAEPGMLAGLGGRVPISGPPPVPHIHGVPECSGICTPAARAEHHRNPPLLASSRSEHEESR
jgi:8-oxo-dGTP diphosphatase